MFQLTKPRIIELLLVTKIPTMLLAQRDMPSLRVFAVTLIGGTLTAIIHPIRGMELAPLRGAM